MRTRAFTMLEVVLATAIGSIVLIACLGLFATINRTEARIGERAHATHDLGRMRVIIQRAFGSLLVDDSPMPTPGFAGSAEDLIQADPATPPRFVLAPMPSRGARRTFARARAMAGGSGSGVQTPQRFELLLSRAPVTRTPPRLSSRPGSPVRPRREDSTGERTLEARQSGPARGAFELWPEGYMPGTLAADRAWSSAQAMTLWWVPAPLDRPATGTGAGAPDAQDERPADEELQQLRTGPYQDLAYRREFGEPVPLAHGLTFCRWQVFRQREFSTEYAASRLLELPAYVTLEVETEHGLYANWMFELMWTIGNDPAAREDESAPDDEDAQDGADAGGANTPNAGDTGDEGAQRLSPGGAQSTGPAGGRGGR